ncbi:MAG: outer membrane beta-barrel protein, partial [Nitrospirota bacterium]
DRKDDAVGGAVGLEYRPDLRLTFSVSGRHEKDKFLPEGERRKIYSASGGVVYQLTRDATFSMTYIHTKEDASVDIRDYTNNVVAVQVRMAL